MKITSPIRLVLAGLVAAGSLYYDMGSRFGTRVRARYSNLSVDMPGSGTSSVSGIGSDRLYDWNLEAGIKFVWR